MPALGNIQAATQVCQVYHYRHFQEVVAPPSGASPTDSRHYRSCNLLVVILNKDGTICEDSVIFAHKGKFDELPYRIAAPLHGRTRGHTRSDGTVEVSECSFNYLGAGYELRHLQFLRVFNANGISPLIGHRVADPTYPVYQQWQMPWCCVHRLSPAQEVEELANVQMMPSTPPPGRDLEEITPHLVAP